jgi:hypothetical protein
LEAGAIVYRQRDTTNNVLRINDQQEEVKAELERLKLAASPPEDGEAVYACLNPTLSCIPLTLII